ncbi:MAG: hypothetical protein MUF15_28110 [Acidobacteria bacterium]|nr:hypothetical protein [Acidobacteriota bacterium]
MQKTFELIYYNPGLDRKHGIFLLISSCFLETTEKESQGFNICQVIALFFHAKCSLHVQIPSAHESKALLYSLSASHASFRQSAHALVVSLIEKKITEYTENTEKKEKQRPLTDMESQEKRQAIKFDTQVRTKNKPGILPVFPVRKMAFNINSSPGRAGKIRQEDEEVAQTKGSYLTERPCGVFHFFKLI